MEYMPTVHWGGFRGFNGAAYIPVPLVVSGYCVYLDPPKTAPENMGRDPNSNQVRRLGPIFWGTSSGSTPGTLGYA